MYNQPYREEGQGLHTSATPTTQQEEQEYENGFAVSTVNSLLVADCGAIFTKVSLFGLVEGQYRLMARGESPTTTEDITQGVIQAINIIEVITGRRFVVNGQIFTPEQDSGDGVDGFIATVSAGGPLRMVILGAVDATLQQLAAQAASGLYTEVYAIPAPTFVAATSPVSIAAGSHPGQQGSGWTPELIAQEGVRQRERLRDLQPHVALIVGMANGPAGPIPLQEACQLLTYIAQERSETMGQQNMSTSASSCSVLYAGAPQYVEAVRRLLNGFADVTRVDSLVSQAQLGSISIAIGALHERNVMRQIGGYEQLQAWSSAPPVATATSLSSLVRFLAQHYAMNVTAIDVGGATTTLMLAGEHGAFIPKVNAGVGVASGLGTILQQVGFQRVVRWLPFSITEDELRQFVMNRMLHPQALPTSTRELQITQAFAREAMILTIDAAKKNSADWPDADLILATGGILSHAPKNGQIALMLLDALQPRGITSLVVDKTMLISQLGAVATIAPITAVQVNENDAVTHRIGTCVVPFGTMQPGQNALTVEVEYTNGRQLKREIQAGTIEVIPLSSNEQALLSLFPAPTVDVGLGPGEQARAAEEIDGGLVGLIIDARGRPLVLPTDETERQARLLQWMQTLNM